MEFLGLDGQAWVNVGQAFLGAGLATVVFEGVITELRERRNRKKHATYLSLRVATVLDRFALECAELAYNNESPFSEGVSMNLPKLAGFPDDADGWKSINARLASECLSLPQRVRESQSLVDAELMEGSDPPSVVALHTIKLGMAARSVAKKFRQDHGLSEPELHWDFEEYLRNYQARLDGTAKVY